MEFLLEETASIEVEQNSQPFPLVYRKDFISKESMSLEINLYNKLRIAIISQTRVLEF
jgi:hypothetical protein